MQKFIFSAFIFLLPLFYWTYTPNFFSTPKQIVMIGAVFLLSLAWAVKTFTSRTLTTSSSPVRFGLFAFALVIITNLFINPVNRLESMIGPASIYLLLIAITYFLTIYAGPTLHFSLITSFLGSTTVLTLHTLLQLTFLYKLDSLPAYMQSRAFTLTGSPLTTFILIAIGASVSLFLALKYPKFKTIYTVSSIISIIAMVSLGILLLPGGELTLPLLPLRASWNIMLDAMKSSRSFFLGVGLSQFPNFFKSVKPLFLNTTPYWNLIPSSSSSEFLQILTTMGVVGFLSFLSLPLFVFKNIAHDPFHTSFKIICLLSGLSLILSPGSIPLLFIFFASIGILGYVTPDTKSLTQPASITLSLTVFALSLYLGYATYLLASAEINIRQAQLALANSDGKTIYERHLSAIALLPSMTSYRTSYSQVNLSLAGALSQKKDDLTETERQNISQLISQSIREAKLATNLSPTNSSVWQNLGSIYKNLINVAEGTDKFAIDSYAQAVALDPGNPALRIEFGGLLYQIAQSTKEPEAQLPLYNRAQNEFQTAIQLKPDYPNAYYNLSKLLETVKDYQGAYLALQKSISLLGPESPDLARAGSELSALQTKLPKPTPRSEAETPSEAEGEVGPLSITTPTPLPSPIPGGLIDLP